MFHVFEKVYTEPLRKKFLHLRSAINGIQLYPRSLSWKSWNIGTNRVFVLVINGLRVPRAWNTCGTDAEQSDSVRAWFRIAKSDVIGLCPFPLGLNLRLGLWLRLCPSSLELVSIELVSELVSKLVSGKSRRKKAPTRRTQSGRKSKHELKLLRRFDKLKRPPNRKTARC